MYEETGSEIFAMGTRMRIVMTIGPYQINIILNRHGAHML